MNYHIEDETDFGQWLRRAQAHPFGYQVLRPRLLDELRRGCNPRLNVPAEILPRVQAGIEMFRKEIVWFDSEHMQIGASTYQGLGEWLWAETGIDGF